MKMTDSAPLKRKQTKKETELMTSHPGNTAPFKIWFPTVMRKRQQSSALTFSKSNSLSFLWPSLSQVCSSPSGIFCHWTAMEENSEFLKNRVIIYNAPSWSWAMPPVSCRNICHQHFCAINISKDHFLIPAPNEADVNTAFPRIKSLPRGGAGRWDITHHYFNINPVSV